jgi:murein DD-endopeptidase MepM/ murein hydrolase activator NlpD
VLALVLLLVTSVDGAIAAPKRSDGPRRTDLSRAIASVRPGQVAAELAMRSADHRIRVLRKLRRKTARHVRASQRRVERQRDRRAEARVEARLAQAGLAAARADLARVAGARSALVLGLASGLRTAQTTAAGSASAPLAADPRSEGDGDPAGDQPDDEGTPPAHQSTADQSPAQQLARLDALIVVHEARLTKLQAQAKRLARVERRVERRTRRSWRRARAAERRAVSVRQGMRATIGQREGAEAVLISYIRTMTRLAYRRAERRTKGTAPPAFGMPVQGRISQGYHRGHDGLDIVAARGTPIRAMATGVVSYVGWNPWDSRPRAFMVVLVHQGGYETKYGHLLPRRGVGLGRLVRRGEVIGYMGNTGHSTGVHLHLEVSRGFRTMSPYAVL